MKTISLTGKDRPQLFQELLRCLVANDLREWTLSIAIEPTPIAGEFVTIARDTLGDVDYSITVNERVLGIRRNPFEVIKRNFEQGSDLNLCLEEDLLLSPDATELALWYQRNHRAYWLCMCLLAGPCGSASLVSNPRHPDVLFEATTFNSIGFVIRRQEWTDLERGVWMGTTRPHQLWGGHADWRFGWGWDWSVYGYLAANPELRCVQPAFGRATHNGVTGTHSHPEAFSKKFGQLPINHQRSPDLHLVAVEDLPNELRSQVYAHEELTAMRQELEDLEVRHRHGLP